MTALEKDIEQKLRKLVEKRGGKCLKWICPGWRGVPDRIILLPGGRVYFVELKRPKGGTPSKLQKKWAEWLRRLGFESYFIYNPDELAVFDLLLSEKQ